MKVVVTGASGFIGSHVVDRLRAQGHEPRNFDLLPSPYDDTVETVIGDLRSPEDVRRGLDGCDAVIHLAAAADVNMVAADPVLAEELNSRGTAVVLEAARELGIRVVFGSTIWVYGDGQPDETLDEDASLPLPKHLYTATKLAGEAYCRSYGELYGVEQTILRFGIPYGPRARSATVLAAFVAKARAGEPLTLAGDGAQSRRFVYVEDLADGVVAGLAPAATGRIYNLVGEESTTIREIAEIVQELVAPVEIVYVEGRAGDIRGAAISGQRAAAELGWQPKTTFAQGARRYVDWVTATQGAPMAATASSIDGRAATV
jgi:UDP-glucose 4-epimerase